MRIVILLLAIAGGLAVFARVIRSLMRLLHRGIDAFVAREVADLRAQKGDLTGLADAARHRADARRRRLFAIAALSFWVVLLVVPPLTPWPALLYALYSVLWLIPHELPRR